MTLRLTIATPRLGVSGSRRLSNSPSRGVSDSPTRQVGELPTLRLADFLLNIKKPTLRESQRLPRVSYSRASATPESQRLPRVSDSPTRRVANSPTHRVGESFFDYEYLREFEAKIETARKVVLGIYEEPISAKTQKNPPHCHVPLKEGYT